MKSISATSTDLTSRPFLRRLRAFLLHPRAAFFVIIALVALRTGLHTINSEALSDDRALYRLYAYLGHHSDDPLVAQAKAAYEEVRPRLKPVQIFRYESRQSSLVSFPLPNFLTYQLEHLPIRFTNQSTIIANLLVYFFACWAIYLIWIRWYGFPPLVFALAIAASMTGTWLRLIGRAAWYRWLPWPLEDLNSAATGYPPRISALLFVFAALPLFLAPKRSGKPIRTVVLAGAACLALAFANHPSNTLAILAAPIAYFLFRAIGLRPGYELLERIGWPKLAAAALVIVVGVNAAFRAWINSKFGVQTFDLGIETIGPYFFHFLLFFAIASAWKTARRSPSLTESVREVGDELVGIFLFSAVFAYCFVSYGLSATEAFMTNAAWYFPIIHIEERTRMLPYHLGLMLIFLIAFAWAANREGRRIALSFAVVFFTVFYLNTYFRQYPKSALRENFRRITDPEILNLRLSDLLRQDDVELYSVSNEYRYSTAFGNELREKHLRNSSSQ